MDNGLAQVIHNHPRFASEEFQFSSPESSQDFLNALNAFTDRLRVQLMARRKNELNPVEEMLVGVFLIVATISAAITAAVKSAEAGALIALIVCVIALTAILKSAVRKLKFQRAVPGISVPSTSDEAVNGRTFHIHRAECRSARDHGVSVSNSNGPEKAGRDKRA
jgi:hypothetical protein